MVNSYIPVSDPASAHTEAISHLFITVLVVCVIILLIVIGMVAIGLIRFRQRPGSVDPRPHFGNRKLEPLWTIGPTLIVIWLFILSARGMRDSDPVPPPNQEPDLIIIGHQIWWEARYPKAGVVTANEIHLPTGAKWLVRMESADVIHDFWMLELARKNSRQFAPFADKCHITRSSRGVPATYRWKFATKWRTRDSASC